MSGGRGSHPAGLRGRDIGMFYAARGKQRKVERERQERPRLSFGEEREASIARLLSESQGDRQTDSAAAVDRAQDSFPPHRGSGYGGQHHSHRSRDQRQHYGYREEHQQQHRSHHSHRQRDSQDSYEQQQQRIESISREKDKNSVPDSWDDDSAPLPSAVADDAAITSSAAPGSLPESMPPLPAAPSSNSFSSNAPTVMIETAQLSAADAAALNDKLQRDALARQTASSGSAATMRAFRENLPAFHQRKEILAAIHRSQIVVISGETGCGKTTQVPQFLLEDAIDSGKGAACRIICTQPRRISAVSVAQRVAQERGEPCGDGSSVGYQIRLERRLPRPHGSILFCTTGILLRHMTADRQLTGISHLVVDEVHERDLLSDFLLIVLRDVLPVRPDLKLVLMSATLNAQLFATYFGQCPTLEIPGFMFPVQQHYAEDIVQMLRYRPVTPSRRPPSQSSHHGHGHGHGHHGRHGHHSHRGGGRGRHSRERRGDDEQQQQQLSAYEDAYESYLSHLETSRQCFPNTVASLREIEFETEVELDLIAALIHFITTSGENGAILCFLPGWDEISKLHERLQSNALFRDPTRCILIPLHSLMPTVNQREVFDIAPRGVRKIVLATNIAETSITIPDVVHVIDCGKIKQKGYDAHNKIASLQTLWTSKASARQRQGRAGRVQPGHCYRIYTRFHYDSMAEYQMPEMQRTPLEELCLQIKLLNLGLVRPFLAQAMEPPSDKAVANALDTLKMLSALDDHEELTALGYHLGSLPVDPRVGKMLLFGAMFSCLDPVLTIAAALGFKDPFVIPLAKQREADRMRKQLARGSYSDHLTLVHAFDGWRNATNAGIERQFCWEHFLSINTLNMLSGLRTQLLDLLVDIGFVDRQNLDRSNLHAGNVNLVKAVMCAGLYPHVVKVQHAQGRSAGKRPPKLHTKEDGRVTLHPRSVLADEPFLPTQWLLYHQKVKSSKVFLYDATMISPFPLIFFGGKTAPSRDGDQEVLAVDEWITFQAPARTAALVMQLRAELDRLLREKIQRPSLQLSVAGMGVLQGVIELITSQVEDTQAQLQRLASGKHLYTRTHRAEAAGHEESDDEEDDDDPSRSQKFKCKRGRFPHGKAIGEQPWNQLESKRGNRKALYSGEENKTLKNM
eukprot:m.196144 g.196144  ORF g.196144 m.196144 type:complete len:1140 (+) comp17646_c0_seq1:67-3486(+)